MAKVFKMGGICGGAGGSDVGDSFESGMDL